MLLTIELWTKYWMTLSLSYVSWWHNVMVSAMLTLPHHRVWSVSALVTIIRDKDPGARCGLGNGHRGNAVSSNVVLVLINDQQSSQEVSTRDHTQDGICVSFVWVPMMIIQHFLNVVAKWPLIAEVRLFSSLPMMIRKGLKPNITLHLYNRRFKWVFFSWIFVRVQTGKGMRVISKALFNFKTVCARHFTNVLLIWSSF